MTLATPLARAVYPQVVVFPGGAQVFPFVEMARLRADPETVAALAEALHDRYHLLFFSGEEGWNEDAAALADALFGAKP